MLVSIFTGFLWCVTAFLLLDAIRRRQRLQGLRALRATPLRQDAITINEAGTGDYRVWIAHGAVVPEGVALAAVVLARNEGLVALDVVPTDWPGLDAFDFARRTDTRTYRDDKLARGVSAACMLVASTRHLERIGPSPEESRVDPVTLASLSERLKVIASDRANFRIGPGVVAPRTDEWSAVITTGSQCSGRLRAAWSLIRVALWFVGLALYCALDWSAFVDFGLAMALVCWLFQPAIALGGGAWSPNDLAALIWSRPIIEAIRSIRVWRMSSSRVEQTEDVVETAMPIANVHSANRCCPVCGQSEGTLIMLKDRWLLKSGEFSWVQCECGTVYAKRLLNPYGRAHYWNRRSTDFGTDAWSIWNRYHRSRHEDKLRFVYRFLDPSRWLDINCGDGAFGAVATQCIPAMEMEGYDRLDWVHTAVRRRWLSRGHRGSWAACYQDGLRHRRFGVISSWHGFERGDELRTVLSDAHSLLTEHGVLALEMLDPTGLDALLLGALWPGWNAPYKDQQIPLRTMEKLLQRLEWRRISRERRRAHRVGTVTLAWVLSHRERSLTGVVSFLGWRWTIPHLIRCALGLPITALADAILWLLVIITGRSNSYRLLMISERTDSATDVTSQTMQ